MAKRKKVRMLHATVSIAGMSRKQVTVLMGIARALRVFADRIAELCGR